jgi:hypothetical protein
MLECHWVVPYCRGEAASIIESPLLSLCKQFKCVWFEKNNLIKIIFDWDWFDIYICLIKIVVEIEVE